MPIANNSFSNKHFLDSAICVSDILDKLGYEQHAFLGYDGRFAGSIGLFNTHKIKAIDFFDLKQMYHIGDEEMEDYKGFWGFKDMLVLQSAKDYLANYRFNKPFALYVPLGDTHASDGFVDKVQCPNLGLGYISSIKCTDKILNDFIKFIQESEFGANTTIVILGDHLSMKQNFFPKDSQRFVYNAFINPHFSKNPTTDLMKNRQLSHFDISALILDSIGLRVESFGLGRNPIYHKTLLEMYGLEKFNQLTTQDSRVYESFWEKR